MNTTAMTPKRNAAARSAGVAAEARRMPSAAQIIENGNAITTPAGWMNSAAMIVSIGLMRRNSSSRGIVNSADTMVVKMMMRDSIRCFVDGGGTESEQFAASGSPSTQCGCYSGSTVTVSLPVLVIWMVKVRYWPTCTTSLPRSVLLIAWWMARPA